VLPIFKIYVKIWYAYTLAYANFFEIRRTTSLNFLENYSFVQNVRWFHSYMVLKIFRIYRRSLIIPLTSCSLLVPINTSLVVLWTLYLTNMVVVIFYVRFRSGRFFFYIVDAHVIFVRWTFVMGSKWNRNRSVGWEGCVSDEEKE